MKEHELDGMKLLLAVPTYGPVDPVRQKELRTGVMFASNHGVEWVGDVSVDRVNVGEARNLAAQSLLDSDEANGIFWVDSDISQEPQDIARLLLSVKNIGAEFASGVYHQRNPPYHATIFRWIPRKSLWRSVAFYPPNSIEKLDACGFGFVYTSKSAMQKIASSKGFKSEEGWFPDKRGIGGYGEDMSFCYQAMTIGVQLYVDTGVIVGHAGDSEVVHPRTHTPQIFNGIEQEEKKGWGIK